MDAQNDHDVILEQSFSDIRQKQDEILGVLEAAMETYEKNPDLYEQNKKTYSVCVAAAYKQLEFICKAANVMRCSNDLRNRIKDTAQRSKARLDALVTREAKFCRQN